MENRIEKINDLLRDELAQLIHKKFPGKFVTVKTVETAPDLKDATIWIAILDEKDDRLVDALNEEASDFHYALKKKLSLRYIPNLYFKLDKSDRHAQRIEKILREKQN